MRNPQKIADLIVEQGILRLARPPPLSVPERPQFTTPANRDAARERLLYLRHRINGKKEPSKSFRAKVGIRNRADIEEINSTFSLQERRDAFDSLLQNREPVGIAQAVLDYHPDEALDINVRHVDSVKSFWKKGDESHVNTTASRWLQVATQTCQEDYVILLATRAPSQDDLDESLKFAIQHRSAEITRVLLQCGANSNTRRDEFNAFAANGDLKWTKLLLNSIKPMDQSTKDKAMLKAVNEGDYNMVHTITSFGANANYRSGSPIVSAIQNSDFRLLTLLLSTSASLEDESLRRAMSCACTDAGIEREFRANAIEILLAVGANIVSHDMEPLLFQAVNKNDQALISLLVDYDQISLEDATQALAELPGKLLQDDVSSICQLLFKTGATGRELGALLYWAVTKDYDHLVELLVDHEVSLDFQHAAAVRIVLEHSNMDMLRLLLRNTRPMSTGASSTDTVLAKVLPQALEISSRRKRHEAVSLLIQKGVAGPCVNTALFRVVTDPAITDIKLVQKLLDGGASVNYYQGDKNCILNAAEEGNLKLLDLMSESKYEAIPHILSQATLSVYKSRMRSSTAEVLDILTKLLQRGAECQGEFVARTLILAVQAADEDDSEAIVKLMLQYGVDINYQNGESIKGALELKQDRSLAAICSAATINQNSFAQTLPLAIEASREDQSKLDILLRAGPDFQGIISDCLIAEVQRQPLGGQDGIVYTLLKNGASVDHKEGEVFRKAIGIEHLSKSIASLVRLLAQRPSQIALSSAFNAARGLQCPLNHRHALFKLILLAGYKGSEIHTALVESIDPSENDLAIPRLLLQHEASVNHDEGAALVLAAEHGNIETIDLFIKHKPNRQSLNRAFATVFQSNIPDSRRIEIFTSLLATKNISRRSIAHAMTHAITHGNFHEILLTLLARHGPAIEPEALLSLVSQRNIITAQLLFQHQIPDVHARSQALGSCLDLEAPTRLAFAKLLIVNGLENAAWMNALRRAIQDQDSEFLRILLKHRPDSGLEIGEALVLSMDTINPVIVDILLRHGPTPTEVNKAFDKMLTSGKMQSNDDSIAAAALLLEQGVSQPLKNRALTHSLESLSREKSDFHKMLIQHGADVNYDSCICFSLAGQLDTLDVFDFLLHSAANFDSVIQSLVSNFPKTRYTRLMELIYVTLNCRSFYSERKDVTVVFEAMRRFEHGDGLIRLLLDHDYPAGQTMFITDGTTSNTESVTPLIWALGQSRPGIDDKVILELLTHGEEARPGFVTEISQVTALGLAARSGRHDILERLLKLRVDVSAVDSDGKSPLFHAVSKADSMAVCMLLEKGTHSNDGSLHEAARLCHKGIIAMLLAKGHDPDYACDLHEGRTALGELCFQTILTSGEQMSKAYSCIELFISTPVDLDIRITGKTILHLALENNQPLEITKTLLRFPEIYEKLRTDSETFIYEDSSRRFMSPDRYTRLYCRHREDVQSALIDLLLKKGCKEKWFTRQGEQLPDCTGLPPALKEAMNTQDIADQTERRAIQRRLESARVDIDIKQRLHNANLLHAKEQAELEFFNINRIHQEQIAHENAVSTQRRQNDNAARSDERYHIAEKNRLEHASLKKLKALEFSSQQQMNQLEQSAQQYKQQERYVALEREAKLENLQIESREAADRRSQARAMARFERQDKSVLLAAKEQRALIAAAQRASINNTFAGQLAITNEEPD